MERSGLALERRNFLGGGKRSSEESVGEINGGDIRPSGLKFSVVFPAVGETSVVSASVVVVAAAVVVVAVVDDAQDDDNGAIVCRITAGTGERRIVRVEAVCLNLSISSSSISMKGSCWPEFSRM